MSLPFPSDSRKLLHDRSIRVRAYARDDGLTDLDAELIDTKGYDFPTSAGVHRAGEPIHFMRLRVTFNDAFDIVASGAVYDAAPFGEHCRSIDTQYADLVGMNLVQGFRHSVKARFGNVKGCTHMSELAMVLPTAAVQSMAGRRRVSQAGDNPPRPLPIDGCHAMRNDGPVVQEYFPRWYKVPKGAPPHPTPGEKPSGPAAASFLSSSSDS